GRPYVRGGGRTPARLRHRRRRPGPRERREDVGGAFRALRVDAADDRRGQGRCQREAWLRPPQLSGARDDCPGDAGVAGRRSEVTVIAGLTRNPRRRVTSFDAWIPGQARDDTDLSLRA